PMALIRPAIDDCISQGLLLEAEDRVELSEQGREQFRAFVRELWGWLVTEVELANGEPLDEQGRDDLRTIARRQMLSDDPVTEPIDTAQAGARQVVRSTGRPSPLSGGRPGERGQWRGGNSPIAWSAIRFIIQV